MASITSANALLYITIPGVFGAPQQIQQFSADNIFEIPEIQAAENMMGVDGHLTSGFVFVPFPQNITLMADSPSGDIFDTWYDAERLLVDKYPCSGLITLKSVGKTWSMARGFLTTYVRVPAAAKVLQPRRFTVTWESMPVAAL